MKAKQIESACKDRSETQVGSQGPLVIVFFFMLSTTNMEAEVFINRFFLIDFSIIIDDRSAGSI